MKKDDDKLSLLALHKQTHNGRKENKGKEQRGYAATPISETIQQF